MKLISKLMKGVVGLVLVCVLLMAVVFIFIFWKTDPLHLRAPSDDKLIEIFRLHREAFEKLRQMGIEDRSIQSTFNVRNLSEKLNESRREEYRVLLSEIYPGVELAMDDSRVNNVVMFVFAKGFISAIAPEWQKGLEYAPGKFVNGEILQSLNSLRNLPPGSYLRPIEKDWFIVYQYED
jgi:hypothetical protein